MAIIVEGYVDGKKVSYDLVKYHHLLTETLEKKGILTKEDIKSLYKQSQ